MAGTIVFFSSLALLIAFFSMRALEMKRGFRYYARFRQEADERIVTLVRTLYHARISDEHKQAVKQAMHVTAHKGVVALIAFIRSVERHLVETAERIRHRAHPKQSITSSVAPSSAFLGAVVEHKNDLKKAVRKMAARIKPAPAAQETAKWETTEDRQL